MVATWNIGSLSSRMADLVSWLVSDQPDLVFIQEAKWSPDVAASLATHLRPLGFWFLVDSRSDFVVVHRVGLQVFSLCPPAGDEDFRLQRISLFLCDGTRLLFRHRHAPSGGSRDLLRRADLEAHLLACADGSVLVDVWDFNEDPLGLAIAGLRPIATPERTFRRCAKPPSPWLTRIDGFRVSDWIDVIDGPRRVVMPSQHALVVCTLGLSADVASHLRWPKLVVSPPAVPPSGHAFTFADAMRTSADAAWLVWHSMAGGSADAGSVCSSLPHGGWTLGPHAARVRRLVFDRSVALGAGDTAAADRAQGSLAELLKTCEVERLRFWRTLMGQRAASARWLRTRITQNATAVSPMLETMQSFGDRAFGFARDLASRWNAQLFRIPDDIANFSITSLCSGFRLN